MVEQRSRIGDWEADTVIGKPGGAVLVTLAERKTCQSILVLSPDKSAKAVKQAIIEALQPHAAHVHTITYDNGKKFAHHAEIASSRCQRPLRSSVPLLGARVERKYERPDPTVSTKRQKF